MQDLSDWLEQIGPVAAARALAALDPDSAVFAVDADRDVVLWSEGAERLLGIPATQALGQSCLSSQRCVRCLQGCGLSRLGQIDGQPLEVYDASGAVHRVRKYALAFRDADGNFLGGVERLVPDQGAVATAAPQFSDDVAEFHGLLTRDPEMKRVFQTIRHVAETEAPVLVRGESGAGKELVARAVHAEGPRRDQPFVAVNCAALSPTLLESELFGHVRGAFTGAVRDRAGLFRQADGGTLFLDEVAELPLELQAKLLRVLEEQRVTPVGGTDSVQVDVRVISATHRSLRQAVNAGRFRRDLMFRLRVVPVFLPALRERRSDIELLLWRFVEQQNQLGPRQIDRVAPDAMRALLDHTWPGNVRELQNVVRYAAAVGRGRELLLSELPPEFRGIGPALPTPGVAEATAAPTPLGDAAERERLRRALEETGGRVSQAAQLLGVSRATFWRKRRKHGL
jgi:transcriptional regulator with PAS, ATPase and Fis domain